MLLRSNPVPDDKIVQPNFVYSATGSPEHPTLGLAPVFDLSVLVCSKDQMNSQHRFLVVIICGYALQLRKLSYDFCAFWVFQCQQLFAVDFVYFSFQGEFPIYASNLWAIDVYRFV